MMNRQESGVRSKWSGLLLLFFFLITTHSLLLTPHAANAAEVSDDFSRADDSDIGVNWTDGYSGQPNLVLAGGEVRPNEVFAGSFEYWSANTFADDQFCEIEIRTLGATGFNSVGCLLRLTTPTTVEGYLIRAVRSSGSYSTQVQDCQAGNCEDFSIAGDSSTWNTGDKLRAYVSGTTLKVFRNDVEIISTSDADYSTGRVGLFAFSDSSVGDAELDNFRGGDGTGAAGGGASSLVSRRRSQ